ncbi:AC4 protein [Begomovirus pyrenacanthae]|nr:AC4 protein [Begomovirus pyrenacanthae]UED98942.1 AC4 protein [Begomovirus pyrenacanthae]
MKMGNLICTHCFNLKANTSAQIHDSSIWSPQHDPHTSIQMFREPNPVLMSSYISTRTATPSYGGSFSSMDDLLEEDNSPQMMLTQEQLTLEVSRRLLEL